MISKQWTGLGKEMFTDADNFGVSFPLDLSVQVFKLSSNHIGVKYSLVIWGWERGGGKLSHVFVLP